MGNWIISGAGTAGYNGTYLEDGVGSGKPLYRLDATHVLYWYPLAATWALGPSVGSVYYLGTGADLPANPWSVGMGEAPAPTVAEAEESDAGPLTVSIYAPVEAESIAGVYHFWASVGIEGANWLWFDWTAEVNVNGVNVSQNIFGGVGDLFNPLGHGLVASGHGLVSIGNPANVGFTLDLRGIENGPGYVRFAANAWSGRFLFGSDSHTFTLANGGAEAGQAPTVSILAPADGAVDLSGTVAVGLVASDDLSLSEVTLEIDGVVVETWSGLSGPGPLSVGYSWDTTAEDNGQHVLRATATDSDAQTGTDTIVVTVDNGEPPSGDTTDPEVEIVAPLEGDTVAREMVVRAEITDNVGVVRAECFVEGISQGELLLPNSGAQWRWVVDLTEFANGVRSLVVEAWDAEGNMGYDAMSVTVGNSLAAATWYIYTEQGSAIAFPGRFRAGRSCGLGLGTLQVETPPENPAAKVNVFLAVDDGVADPPVFEDMQPVEHMRAHGYLANAETVRFGIKGVPQQVLASWETDVVSAIRLREWTEGLLLLTPDSVLAFDGADVTEYADLTTYGTANDMAWWNGKIVVAMGAAGAVFLDPDAGEEAFVVEPPAGCASVDIVEAHGGSLYFGARIDATDGMLWRLGAEYDLVNVEELERVTALASCGATLGVGCAGGKVYSWNGVVLNLALATGETNVTRLALAGGLVLAGTGNTGGVFRSLPGWAADGTFGDTTEVRAFGLMNGRIYAGGDREVIWYRIGDEDWGQAGVVDALEINDMLVWNDGLYMATTGETEGKLWRLEVAPDSELVSGTRKPSFTYEVLRRQ